MPAAVRRGGLKLTPNLVVLVLAGILTRLRLGLAPRE